MATDTKPRLPEVGEYVRMHGTLVEVRDVTPPPPPKQVEYIFESISATVQARANARVIREFSTFNEFYGKGTAVECAIKEARQLQKQFGSDVEFIVVKETQHSQMNPRQNAYLYDPTFLDFDSIGYAKTVSEEIVWSSKQPDSENHDAD